jgi:predicted nicotinamide N-methyase
MLKQGDRAAALMVLPPQDAEAFILGNTTLIAPPHVPEIRLHLADEAHELWQKTEEDLKQIGLPPPFWAFAWAGGQGLSRYILDHPATVEGRRVLDFAAGSGLVGIAAAKAGAASVLAADIDPYSTAGIHLNARANGVILDYMATDCIGRTMDGRSCLRAMSFTKSPSPPGLFRGSNDSPREGRKS